MPRESTKVGGANDLSPAERRNNIGFWLFTQLISLPVGMKQPHFDG